jgi:hypothetical protein
VLQLIVSLRIYANNQMCKINGLTEKF